MIGPKGTPVASRLTHTHEEIKTANKGQVIPHCVIYMSANRMWEDRRRPMGEGFQVSRLLCRPFLTLSAGAEIDGSQASYMAGGLALT